MDQEPVMGILSISSAGSACRCIFTGTHSLVGKGNPKGSDKLYQRDKKVPHDGGWLDCSNFREMIRGSTIVHTGTRETTGFLRTYVIDPSLLEIAV